VAAAMTQDVMKHVQKMLELHAIKKTQEAQNLVTPDKAAAKGIHEVRFNVGYGAAQACKPLLAPTTFHPDRLPHQTMDALSCPWCTLVEHDRVQGLGTPLDALSWTPCHATRACTTILLPRCPPTLFEHRPS